MPPWPVLLFAALALLVVGVAAALRVAAGRWETASARAVERLPRRAPTDAPSTVDFTGLDALPPPVARYFRWALRDGQALVKSARLAQEGAFRARRGEEIWGRMRAAQRFTARPPGFVWDAAIRAAPLADVRVRDGYAAGEGSMQAKLLGLFTVVDERGLPELAAGALQRWLAEAVWFPTALLPGDGLSWSPIDERRALATVTDGPLTVSLEFRFGADGAVEGFFAPARPREVNGCYAPTPWEGRLSAFAERGGMRVPTVAEVAWLLPEGRFPYWRGRVTDFSFELAGP